MSALRDVAGQLTVAIRTRSLIVTRGLTEGQHEGRRAWNRIEDLLDELLARLDKADAILTPLESWEEARKAQGERAEDVARQLVAAIEGYGLPVDPRAAREDPQRVEAARLTAPSQLELGGVKKPDTPARGDAVLPAGDRSSGNPPP